MPIGDTTGYALGEGAEAFSRTLNQALQYKAFMAEQKFRMGMAEEKQGLERQQADIFKQQSDLEMIHSKITNEAAREDLKEAKRQRDRAKQVEGLFDELAQMEGAEQDEFVGPKTVKRERVERKESLQKQIRIRTRGPRTEEQEQNIELVKSQISLNKARTLSEGVEKGDSNAKIEFATTLGRLRYLDKAGELPEEMVEIMKVMEEQLKKLDPLMQVIADMIVGNLGGETPGASEKKDWETEVNEVE